MKRLLFLVFAVLMAPYAARAEYSPIGVAEDTAHSNGESLAKMGCRQKATPANSAGTDGDWQTVDCKDGAVAVYVAATAVGSTTADDDGSVAGGTTSMSEVLSRNYCYDGTNWVRCNMATGIEDAAETAGGYLSMMGSVRRDTAASSAGATGDNATINTDANGYLWGRSADPCSGQIPTTVAISQTGDTKIVTKTASKKTYVCGGAIVAGAAEIFNIVEGTQTTNPCDTSAAALVGSTTDANGMSFAANGGLTINKPISGISSNVDLCLMQSGSNRLSGWITYVQQ